MSLASYDSLLSNFASWTSLSLADAKPIFDAILMIEHHWKRGDPALTFKVNASTGAAGLYQIVPVAAADVMPQHFSADELSRLRLHARGGRVSIEDIKRKYAASALPHSIELHRLYNQQMAGRIRRASLPVNLRSVLLYRFQPSRLRQLYSASHVQHKEGRVFDAYINRS